MLRAFCSDSGWLLEKTLSVSESGGSFGSGRRLAGLMMIASQVLQRSVDVSKRASPRQESNKGIKKSGSLLECVTPMQVRIHYLLGRIIAIGYSYMYSIQR